MRPLGRITDDLEPLILELCDEHELQWGEVLNIIRGYMEIHCPDSQELYNDGTVPIFFYGHKNSR